MVDLRGRWWAQRARCGGSSPRGDQAHNPTLVHALNCSFPEKPGVAGGDSQDWLPRSGRRQARGMGIVIALVAAVPPGREAASSGYSRLWLCPSAW
jgi:hypothetical protein